MGAVLVLRGAGSRSYGKVRADIVALFPNGGVIVAQAKHSKRTMAREERIFHRSMESHLPWSYRWWVTPKDYRKDIEELKKWAKGL